MRYENAVSYIEEIPRFTTKHELWHTRAFLKHLGNPGMEKKILHVAGTNGKGSVCVYMQAILLAEGKRVGFFTSPHLISVNERIRIDSQVVDDDTFLGIFVRVKEAVDVMAAEGMEHPTYYEFLFGMGMLAFEEADTEYIILETGIGGRLDATNSIEHPLLTVITSISLDHTGLLGSTIAEIAFEKAGILKEGVPVFCDGSNVEALAVIRRQAEAVGSRCREISKNAYEFSEITDKHIAFSRVNAYDGDVTWMLLNGGLYQAMNASLAIAAMEFVFPPQKRHYDKWQQALSVLKWEGRMEEVAPRVFVDGAHNPGAVKAFVESMNAQEEYIRKRGMDGFGPPVILFSVAGDKEYEEMISILCKGLPAKAYIVTEIEDKRRIKAEKLLEVFQRYTDSEVTAIPDAIRALRLALSKKEQDDMVFCLGSLYLAGMVKKQLGR